MKKDDIISRADVVREFIKLFGCIQDVSDIDEWADICQTTVCEIPSAGTDWIPCSERLPSIFTEVLISTKWIVDIGQREEDGWQGVQLGHYDDKEVLAWMPRPNLWRKDGDIE